MAHHEAEEEGARIEDAYIKRYYKSECHPQPFKTTSGGFYDLRQLST